MMGFRAREAREQVASPCTNLCAIDAASGMCRGCLRTLDEITIWGQATNEERLEILAAVARRKIDVPDPKP